MRPSRPRMHACRSSEALFANFVSDPTTAPRFRTTNASERSDAMPRHCPLDGDTRRSHSLSHRRDPRGWSRASRPLSTFTRHSRHKLQIHAQCPAPQPRTAHRAVHHATPAPHGRATPRADRTRDTPTHRTAATPVTATRHSATAPDRGTGPLLAAERWHRGPHTPQYTQITLYWNAKTKYI